jgi:hypothetical protein
MNDATHFSDPQSSHIDADQWRRLAAGALRKKSLSASAVASGALSAKK